MTLATSLTAKQISAADADENPHRRQTLHAAIAIIKNSNDHIGPKIQLGGLKDGLSSAAYQPLISEIVNALPIADAPKQATNETTKPKNC